MGYKNTDPETIEQLYYNISQVAHMIGESAITVRYWMKYFGLQTKRGRGFYRKFVGADITKLQFIQNMIRVEGRRLEKVKELIKH